MFTQGIQQEEQAYSRKYPRFRTVRILHKNLERIKARSSQYGESVYDIIAKILDQLEAYEIEKTRSIMK